MGSLEKVMSMIPGMGASQPLPPGQEQAGTKRIKRFMTIMDSMTDDELDCKKHALVEKNFWRIVRVAKGSGTHPLYVDELMCEYKRFSTMVNKMGKAGLMKETGDMQNLTRNPKQVMQKLQSRVDP